MNSEFNLSEGRRSNDEKKRQNRKRSVFSSLTVNRDHPKLKMFYLSMVILFLNLVEISKQKQNKNRCVEKRREEKKVNKRTLFGDGSILTGWAMRSGRFESAWVNKDERRSNDSGAVSEVGDGVIVAGDKIFIKTSQMNNVREIFSSTNIQRNMKKNRRVVQRFWKTFQWKRLRFDCHRFDIEDLFYWQFDKSDDVTIRSSVTNFDD